MSTIGQSSLEWSFIEFDNEVVKKIYQNIEEKIKYINMDVLFWLYKSTGLEALPSPTKLSDHGTGVNRFLRPVWQWDMMGKPEKMENKTKQAPSY